MGARAPFNGSPESTFTTKNQRKSSGGKWETDFYPVRVLGGIVLAL